MGWRKSFGAVIHGWAPTHFITTSAGPGSPVGLLVAAAIGIIGYLFTLIDA